MTSKNNHKLTTRQYEKLVEEASTLQSSAEYFQSDVEDQCHPNGSNGDEVSQSSDRLTRLVLGSNFSKAIKRDLMSRLNKINKARQEVYLQSEEVKEQTEKLYDHITKFDPELRE